MAYQSDQSGQVEIYIRSFPDGKGRRRVSVNGGTRVRWRRDSRELFYVELETLMAVPVSTSPTLAVGSPQRLFSSELLFRGYDVAADGQKLVVREPLTDSGGSKIRVVQNWYEEFRDREQD